MAGLQKGTTFVDGNTYVAADLNNLVDNAVPLPTLITQWSQKTTPIDADKFLMSDSANSNALVYATLSNLRTGIGSGKLAYGFTDTGSANAYAVACTPTITSLGTGQVVIFKPANINTTASTLAVDGLTAKNIFNKGGALTGGELIPNVLVEVIYDGTQFNLVSKEQVIVGDSGSGGQQGITPAPATGDGAANRALLASGIFAVPIIVPPEGRLTLQSDTPILTASATNQGTIYYTSYIGKMVPIYNGTSWGNYSLTGTPTAQEISLALDSNSGHTGYHQSGKNFDLFIFNNSGTIALGSGPAWTGDATRGSGAGTTELQKLDGMLTNKNSIALKFDTSASQITVAANQATYIGSFRANANGQTSMTYGPTANTVANLLLFNAYNRIPQCGSSLEDTNSWTYTTATWRSMNNNNNIRVNFLQGLPSENVGARSYVNVATSVNSQVACGIGLNATNSNSAQLFGISNLATINVPVTAHFDSQTSVGFNFLQATEISLASGTTTWIGDLGTSFLIAGIMARVFC